MDGTPIWRLHDGSTLVGSFRGIGVKDGRLQWVGCLRGDVWPAAHENDRRLQTESSR
jgi:hypothetical protein